jgi:hypothetical protein
MTYIHTYFYCVPRQGFSTCTNLHGMIKVIIVPIVEDLSMSLYAFHLGQIISTVFGQVDHDGQHGNAARTPIRDETSETDHTQK